MIKGSLLKKTNKAESVVKTHLRFVEIHFKEKIFGYKEDERDKGFKRIIAFSEIVDCNLELTDLEEKVSLWKFGFKLFTKDKVYVFYAQNQAEQDKWLLPLHVILAKNFGLPPQINLVEKKNESLKYKQSMNFYDKNTLKSDCLVNDGKHRLYDIYDNIDYSQMNVAKKQIKKMKDEYLEPKYDPGPEGVMNINNEDVTDFRFYDPSMNKEVRLRNKNKELQGLVSGNTIARQVHGSKKGKAENRIENLLNDYYVNEDATEVEINFEKYKQLLAEEKQRKDTGSKDFLRELNEAEEKNKQKERDKSSPCKGNVKQMILNNNDHYNRSNKMFLNNFDPSKYYEFTYLDVKKIKGQSGFDQPVKKEGNIVIEGAGNGKKAEKADIQKVEEVTNKMDHTFTEFVNTRDVTAKNVPFEVKVKKPLNVFGNKLNNPNDEFEYVINKKSVDTKPKEGINMRFSPQKETVNSKPKQFQISMGSNTGWGDEFVDNWVPNIVIKKEK